MAMLSRRLVLVVLGMSMLLVGCPFELLTTTTVAVVNKTDEELLVIITAGRETNQDVVPPDLGISQLVLCIRGQKGEARVAARSADEGSDELIETVETECGMANLFEVHRDESGSLHLTVAP